MIVLAAAPAPALGDPLQASPCLINQGCLNAGAATLFGLAAQLAQDGNWAAAAKVLISLQQDKRVEIRSEARFRLARLLEQQGDLPGAIEQYEAILREQPGVGSVRLALSHALARAGKTRRARSELRRAMAGGLPADAALLADRFEAALRSEQPLGAGLETGLAVDSNINHATVRDTVSVGGLNFALTPDAQRQGGIGSYSRGQAFWRPAVAPGINFFSDLSGSANLYGASRFNDIDGALAAGVELSDAQRRVQITAQIDQRWFGQSVYSRSYGGGLSALVAVGQGAQVELAAQIAQVRYIAIDAQSGFHAGGSASIERQFSPKLSIRFTANLALDLAKADPFSTQTYGGSVLIARSFGRTLLYETIAYNRIQGKAPFAFPVATRKDSFVESEIGLQFPAIFLHKFKPVMRLQYVNNRSPVFFYQYSQVRAEFGVTHDF